MKKAIFTVDTEGHDGNDPIQTLIFGKTKDGTFAGIPMIMDICDQYNVKGLFFVDFAEAWDYGKEKIKEVVLYIKNRGHDVGVHIHPDHMADKERMFLSQYSYQEQYDIIKKCTDLYIEITGEKPVAFRAGKYGANRDTLAILSELGYKADFSEYYGYDKWCHIQPPVTDNETVKLKNGIIEFPVISYENYVKGLFHRHDKLDINRSAFEHRYLINRILNEEEIQVISLFCHSFSLLSWRHKPDNPTIKKNEVRHLNEALNHISTCQEIEFSCLDKLIKADYPLEHVNELGVFEVKGVIAYYLYIQKAYATVLSWIQIWLGNHRKMRGKHAKPNDNNG